MFCAVAGCSNHKSKSRYFLFPKNAKLRQKWVEFCRRPDKINTKLEKICIQHFVDSDFERDLPYELGVYKKPRPLKLKTESVPSLSNNSNEEGLDFKFAEELEARDEESAEKEQLAKSAAQRKQIVDALLTEYDEQHVEESVEQLEQEVEQEIVQVVVDADAYLTALEKENILLRRENFKLKLATQKDVIETEKLRQHLDRATSRYNKLLDQLGTIFSRSQIHKLQGGKRIMWPKQELKDALNLYAASPKVYNMLLQKGYPLPSKRLLHHLENDHVENISNEAQDSFELEESSELIEIIDISQVDHNYVD